MVTVVFYPSLCRRKMPHFGGEGEQQPSMASSPFILMEALPERLGNHSVRGLIGMGTPGLF